MKRWHLVLSCLLSLLPVLAAEIISYKWMNPDRLGSSLTLPVFRPPVENSTFELSAKEFNKVKDALACSTGWMGKQGGGATPLTRLIWVEWDRTNARNTLGAFRHMPEQCLGSIGMTLEHIYPQRVYGEGDKQFVFDSTLFRPLRGGQAVFVFKAVWISGLQGAKLRENVLAVNQLDLGALRFAAATHRFNPEHTRVFMAGVIGLPSEELAWKSFSREILSLVKWTTIQPSTEN